MSTDQAQVPYPTPTRLRLAAAVEAGDVRHYWWRTPWSCWVTRDRKVTVRVAELDRAGLVRIPPRTSPIQQYTVVELTDTGRQWLAEHGSNS